MGLLLGLAMWHCKGETPQRRPLGTFPVVTITAPADGAWLTETPVVVEGTVATPATVTVNGAKAKVVGLEFEAQVSLAEGPNRITVLAIAMDGYQNTDSASIQVTLRTVANDLAVTIEGDGVGDDGVPELVIGGESQIPVRGRYSPVQFPVDVVATSAGQGSVTATSDDGTFRLLVPAVADSLWTVTVTERIVRPGTGSARVRLIADHEPPEITIDGNNPRIEDAEVTVVSGTAVDRHSEIADVFMVSDRLGAEPLAVIRGGNGSFYGEVPLSRGDNLVTVTASDTFGNSASAQVTIIRSIGLEPELVITAPAPGTETEAPTIDVAGLVYTIQPPEYVRIVAGDQTEFGTPTDREGVYTFAFPAYPLHPGYNEILVRVETPVGNTEARTWVTYRTEEPPPDMTPVIVITSPRLNLVLADPSVVVAGSIERGVGEVTLTVNEAGVELIGPQRLFQYLLDVSARPSGEIPIVLVATDSADNQATETVVVTRDIDPPVITITTPGIELAPQVNQVVETPFSLAGTVTDANLASLSVNDRPISVVPGAQPAVFEFTARLDLQVGTQQSVLIVARDSAANRTEAEARFLANVPVGIEIIRPRDGDELMVSGSSPTVRVTTRLTGSLAGFTVVAQIDGGTWQTLTLDGNAANGDIPLPGGNSAHELVVEVRDASGAVVARARATFTSVNADDLPLEVIRHEPGNGETGVEPNAVLALYFNKAIDPAQIQILVRETAHGLTYDLDRPPGADMTELSLPELVEVHRDQELTNGNLALFPGNRMIGYHLDRDLAYGAAVYVEVLYDGQELVRFSFSVRPLPTFLHGLVADQLQQPVAGVDVSLPDLDLTATTDTNGNFAFGFGDPADQSLPAGRHRLVINPDLEDRHYGMRDLWAVVQEGRLNQLGTTLIPILNPEVPFRRIMGSQSRVELAGGDLVLDLSAASLLFPSGRGDGDVHVQFLAIGDAGLSTMAYAIPHWVFAFQPCGIEVTGQVGMEIQMPRLYGNYDYIPADGTLVLLVGFDGGSKQAVPVGVGRIAVNRVVSVRPAVLNRLDYLGYAFVENEIQQVLVRFVDNEIDLTQVIAELDAYVR